MSSSRLDCFAMDIGGFNIRNTTSAAMTRFLHRCVATKGKVAVGFANHNFITKCQALRCGPVSGQAVVLLNDGVAIELAALLRRGRRFRENMNGTDFVPGFLRSAHKPYTVYLVGGRRDVVEQAAEAIAAIPNCRVVGACDGFSLWDNQARVLGEIGAASPDILLVGLGNPLQERWVMDNWAALDARVIIGVGALFEWMTGYRRRAPSLVRAARLEWAYRLILEPRRLLRRYTLDFFHFMRLVLRADPRPVAVRNDRDLTVA